MESPVQLDTQHAASNPSPLWVIALFVALSQVMAASAALATGGSAQLIFALFAAVFPFVVLAAFVWLLLYRPLNLYAPGQYTEPTGMREFSEIIGRQGRDEVEIYKQAVAEAVVAGVVEDHDVGAGSVDRQAVLNRVTARFDDVVGQHSVTVDRSLVIEGAEPVTIPVTAETTADEFLDSVWFNISESVEPYTYNDSWVLTDQDSVPLRELGTNWAWEQGWLGDDRKLEDAGIVLGGTYFAIPKKSSQSGRSVKRPWRSQVQTLLTKYECAIEREGLRARRVLGERRPSLVASYNGDRYGLYVMAGRAEPSWIAQAAKACETLAREEGVAISAALALEHKPREGVRAAGLKEGVDIIWLEGDTIRGAPWSRVKKGAPS